MRYLTAALLAAALAIPGHAQAPAAQPYDLLIRQGRVFDGSGNPWVIADVAVKNGRIAAVGHLGDVKATRTIDARGKFVSPGFIDIHSHADGGLNNEKLKHAPNVVAQGITLVVVNQDGRSPLPIRDQKARYEKQGIGPNAALMVGHGAVRNRVMGERANQIATAADIAAMQKLVEEAMVAGAFGVSSGLEYSPGRYSEPREVIEITRPVKRFGGFYISHERSEGRDPMWHVASDPTPYVDLIDAVKETININRQTGVPVVASHLKAKGADFWGASRAATQLIHQARAEGLEVYADQYPYDTTGTDGSTVLIPRWALAAPGARVDAQVGGSSRPDMSNMKANLETRLKDPKEEPVVRKDIEHEIARRGGAPRIILYDHPATQYIEKSLAAIAKDLGVMPVDAAIWLQMNGADRPGGGRMRGYSLSEIDIEHIMQQDFTATCTDGGVSALGDGVPHARYYGTMAKKIRRYALDRGVITLPFAIRSMTSLPAQIMRLSDRGWTREGYWADLVIFEESIEDHATFTEPHQYPTGIPFVFVNGVAVVDEGKLTGAAPGQVVAPGKG